MQWSPVHPTSQRKCCRLKRNFAQNALSKSNIAWSDTYITARSQAIVKKTTRKRNFRQQFITFHFSSESWVSSQQVSHFVVDWNVLSRVYSDGRFAGNVCCIQDTRTASHLRYMRQKDTWLTKHWTKTSDHKVVLFNDVMIRQSYLVCIQKSIF